MSNIKTIETEKIVTEISYETSDGKTWTDQNQALHHQVILDGEIETCDFCNGNGGKRTNRKEFDYSTPIVWVECIVCNGRGTIELVFA